MSKTFDESLKDTARISMSMLDVDDYSDTTSEEFETLRREQQGCFNELVHREDFPFGTYTKSLSVVKGQATYGVPNGIVKNIWYKGSKLTYSDNYLEFDDAKGLPTTYSIKNNPDKIVLYPAPKENYQMTIEYYDDRFVETTSGDYQWEIEIGSTLRMPDRVQSLFFDALEYFLLADHIKKQTNARWQPTLAIAQARWQTFLQGARKSDSDTYFTI